MIQTHMSIVYGYVLLFWSCDLLMLATFIHIAITLLGLLLYNVVFYSRLRYLNCVRSFEISNRLWA